MTRSNDGAWLLDLVRALSRLDNAQAEHVDELAELQQRQHQEDRQNPHRFEGSDPAGYLRTFYADVCYGQPASAATRYEPLRAALRNAEDVLANHPALAEVLRADERWQEFVVRAFDRDYATSRLNVLAGLLCRASDAGENGFETASRELLTLLDRSLVEKCDAVDDPLTTGYHIAVFYGLRLSDEVEIAENLHALPLHKTKDILDIEVLRNVAPPSELRDAWEGVGAIVETVPWRPVLFPPSGGPVREYDMGSFYLDARDFLALLSVYQTTPIVSMAVFPHSTHRTVPLLLGAPRLSGNMLVDTWARGYTSLGDPFELDHNAFEQASGLYSAPDSNRYREYGSVVSRLSEALSRSGRYAEDDRILDVAIALEQMYELDQGEISFKLKIRAACFLKSETKDRLSVFKKVGQLYDARSGIVHRRNKEPSRASKRDAFEAGFDVARESVTKLLREGRPPSWNEVILER